MIPDHPGPRVWQLGGLDFTHSRKLPASGAWDTDQAPHSISLEGIQDASDPGFPSWGYHTQARRCHLILRCQIKLGQREGYAFSILLDPGADAWKSFGYNPARALQVLLQPTGPLVALLVDPKASLDEAILEAALTTQCRNTPELGPPPRSDIQDLIQEAWARAWVRGPTGDPPFLLEIQDFGLPTLATALEGLPAFLRNEVSWLYSAGKASGQGYRCQVVIQNHPGIPDKSTYWMPALRDLAGVWAERSPEMERFTTTWERDPAWSRTLDVKRFREEWKALESWHRGLAGVQENLEGVLANFAALADLHDGLRATLVSRIRAALEALDRPLTAKETVWYLDNLGDAIPDARLDRQTWLSWMVGMPDKVPTSMTLEEGVQLYSQRFAAHPVGVLPGQVHQAAALLLEVERDPHLWAPPLVAAALDSIGSQDGFSKEVWSALAAEACLKEELTAQALNRVREASPGSRRHLMWLQALSALHAWDAVGPELECLIEAGPDWSGDLESQDAWRVLSNEPHLKEATQAAYESKALKSQASFTLALRSGWDPPMAALEEADLVQVSAWSIELLEGGDSAPRKWLESLAEYDQRRRLPSFIKQRISRSVGGPWTAFSALTALFQGKYPNDTVPSRALGCTAQEVEELRGEYGLAAAEGQKAEGFLTALLGLVDYKARVLVDIERDLWEIGYLNRAPAEIERLLGSDVENYRAAEGLLSREGPERDRAKWAALTAPPHCPPWIRQAFRALSKEQKKEAVKHFLPAFNAFDRLMDNVDRPVLSWQAWLHILLRHPVRLPLWRMRRALRLRIDRKAQHRGTFAGLWKLLNHPLPWRSRLATQEPDKGTF